MHPRRDSSRRLLSFARELRSQQTDAERRLWQILRGRRLGRFKFRRQVPVAGYILDFYCSAARLAVEADSGQHDEPEAIAYDERRTAALKCDGIRVLRFWDNVILTDTEAVAETIYRELANPPTT